MSGMKTDVKGIYKVTDGILINKDKDALISYKKSKMKDMKLIKLENDLSSLKSDMEEIKQLLKGLSR
jgi:hypothetical protein